MIKVEVEFIEAVSIRGPFKVVVGRVAVTKGVRGAEFLPATEFKATPPMENGPTPVWPASLNAKELRVLADMVESVGAGEEWNPRPLNDDG